MRSTSTSTPSTRSSHSARPRRARRNCSSTSRAARSASRRLVSKFIVQALRGGPLIVYGDGSQTRSFCYISDMVTALMRLMSTPDQVTGPINVGNPEEV
ncbi:MAG: NAD-dependent epimerase/dehydratase family protein [Rhodospirillales bacterium]|nr:NAD-dependent epimerase/dehydratase family protein [Rhodospirillales bacterium]